MNRVTTEFAPQAIGGPYTISQSSTTVDIVTSGTYRDDFQEERPRLSGKPL